MTQIEGTLERYFRERIARAIKYDGYFSFSDEWYKILINCLKNKGLTDEEIKKIEDEIVYRSVRRIDQ